MITLTGGQFQDASGNLLKKGYLSLLLSNDAAIIAGGQVVRAIPILFPITNGSISSSAKIYSNAELQPSTQYYAQVQDANQKRIGDAQVWQFTQGSGATVDIGTMVPVAGGVVFPAPVILNPTGIQTINGFALVIAGANFGLAAANSSADIWLGRIAANIFGVGKTSGAADATLRLGILQIGGSDTGLTRDSAGVIDIGDGTQGNTSGAARATRFFGLGTGGQSSSSFIASANGSPGYAFNSTGGAADQKWADAFLNTTTFAMRFVNDANSVANAFWTVSRGAGAAVGAITFGAGGGVQTLPTTTGTLARTSGDTFTSTTLTSPTISGGAFSGNQTGMTLQAAGSGNAVTLLNEQGAAGAITGNNTDLTIYTFTIPANTVQAGKTIKITAVSKHTTGNGAVTYKLKLGSTTLDSNAITGNANLGNDDWTYRISNNSGVQNAQHWSRSVVFISGTTGSVAANNGTSAENTANSLALTYTMNAANTEQVTPVQFIVELVQ